MTTSDEDAREEYARLQREVQLANLRENPRLLTSTWQRRASSIAAGMMIVLAMLAGAVLVRGAAVHDGF